MQSILMSVSKKFAFFPEILFFVQGVPCVIGLLVDKKASTYKQIFSELKGAAIRKRMTFSPSLIMTDFESGAISVVKTEVGI